MYHNKHWWVCKPTYAWEVIGAPPLAGDEQVRDWKMCLHAYPFCITTPGTTSFLDVAIATFMTCQWNYLVVKVDKYNCKFCNFLSVKLAKIGRKNIRSV